MDILTLTMQTGQHKQIYWQLLFHTWIWDDILDLTKTNNGSPVANSSCYTGYITLHAASHEIIFLQQFLKSLWLLQSGPTCLYCDNNAASHLTEDHVWHLHTKHIQVKYHSTCELVLAGEALVPCIGSKENIANILTKPLAHSDFKHLHYYLGIWNPSTPA